MDLRNVFRRGPIIVGRLFKRLDPQEAKISVFEHPSSAKVGILARAKIRLFGLIVEKGQSREQIGHLNDVELVPLFGLGIYPLLSSFFRENDTISKSFINEAVSRILRLES